MYWMNKSVFIFLIITSSLLFSACSGDKKTTPPEIVDNGINLNPPVVNAGADQTVTEQSTIVLSSSAIDDKGVISYLWQQTGGTAAVELTSTTNSATSFIAPAVTESSTLEFTITVSDAENNRTSDAVSITVVPENESPVITVPQELTVQAAEPVTLKGTLSDDQSTTLAYNWQQLEGVDVQLKDNGDGSISFVAPVLEASETLTFELSATDDEGAKTAKIVKVNVLPSPKQRINGVVNKGPFALQGEIKYSLLFDDSPASIQQVSGAIIDNLGHYTVELSDNFLYHAEATGQYFSELDGTLQSEEVLLQAIHHIYEQPNDQYSINVLTHITTSRILWLIRLEGATITDAINQAETELQLALNDILSTIESESFDAISLFQAEKYSGSDYLFALSALILEYANNNTDNRNLQWILDSLDADLASNGKLNNSEQTIEGLKLATTTLDVAKAQSSLESFIEGKPEFISSKLDTVIDTDQDGIVNKNDSDDDNDGIPDMLDPSPYSANQLPQVSAGDNITVVSGQAGFLNGSAIDLDGEITQYLWVQTQGSTSVELSDAENAATSFIAPAVATSSIVEFTLTAVDNNGASSSDKLSLTIEPQNIPPVVTTDEDQTVEELTLVTLTGNVNDVDGEIESYSWKQIAGNEVTLLDDGNYSVSFTAPSLLSPETLIFELTAIDNDNANSVSQIKITVIPPTLRAISGVVEKGPFVLGGQVFFSLIPDNGQASESSISATILDNMGLYSISVNDSSLYEAEAEGLFFNELTGEDTESLIKLRAIYFIHEDAGNNYNINVLTHLINRRIKWLMSVNQLEPASAISQAEEELKTALEPILGTGPATTFSLLSLFSSEQSVGSDYLLALSSLLTEYAFSETVSASSAMSKLQYDLDFMEQDFASDGLLDNSQDRLTGLRSAMISLAPNTVLQSLDTLILDREGFDKADLNNIIDTDIDGVRNFLDADDDNDNIPDALDPLPYFPSFLVSDVLINVNEDETALIDTQTNQPTDGDNVLIIETAPSQGVLIGDYTLLEYQPNSNYYGTDEFRYYLVSDDVVSDLITVSIDVNSVNDKPEISGSPITETIANDNYTFTPSAFDEEGEELTFIVENLPAWARFDTETGAIEGIPSNEDARVYSNIIISVTDGIDTTMLDPLNLTVTPNPFTYMTPMPVAVQQGDAVLLNEKVYFFGGEAGSPDNQYQDIDNRDIFVYDIKIDSWETQGQMPIGSAQLHAHAVDELIYVFAEQNVDGDWLTSSYVYDPEDGSWTELTSQPAYRGAKTSSVVDRKIYFFGGLGMEDDGPYVSGSATQRKDDVMIYDTETDNWENGERAPLTTYGACSVADGDSIYLIGGQDATYSDEVHIYTPSSDTWSAATYLPTGRSFPACDKADESLFIIGGFGRSSSEERQVRRYDEFEDDWLPAITMDASRALVPTVSYEDKIYLFGGYDVYGYASQNRTSSVIQFIPEYLE